MRRKSAFIAIILIAIALIFFSAALIISVQFVQGMHRVESMIQLIEQRGGTIGVSTTFMGHPERITFNVPGRQNTLANGDLLLITGTLTQVREINLTGCDIDDRGLVGIDGLKYLHTIFLGFTNIGDDGIRTLSRSRSLRELYIHNTDVSPEAIMEHVSHMKSLEMLTINREVLTDAELDELRKRLPNTRITPMEPVDTRWW